ncbi:MAG TPA: hypothetical protein VFV72_04575 [Candidatus Limnocylindrales bacterium]|nr:hypothetical protein [Candidatus Limnocylindrales bacterium]
MSRSMRLPFRQGRDPWWDMEGRTVRRLRRRRVAVSFGILVVAAVLLAFVWGVPGVRAASTTVNLDQWASKDNAWQNGNLNGNNSKYPEGGIVPFRVAFEGVSTGTHTIHINYDFTASGHKAYDFLATWDVTNAKGKICAASGGAISSKCPSLGTPSSYPFPNDGYKANGLTVHGAELYSAAPRRLTIYGGTITSIKGPVHSGSPDGNSTADFVVTFKNTRSAVLLSWGGHLAQSAYWDTARGGPRDGASMVSGAPWHMRTLQLDGSGNKNQDRSIQPSAIVGELPPFALAPPTPTPRPTSPPNNPGNPGSPGNPPGGATTVSGPGPGNPGVTVPPTTALADPLPRPAQGSLPAVIGGLLAVGLAAVLGARRAGGGRSRRR